MKHTKKLAQRIAAGAMSAALLFSGSPLGNANQTVKAEDNDYYQALALSLYFFDANACGSDVDAGPLTWRGDCHVEDEKALLSNATGFDASLTSLVDPDGDGKVDVGGGYHDAGDHIKFNLTMGFGMSSLAMSEFLNPGVYAKAGCLDHLIAICKRNAEYMMKTTFLDASGNVATICHVVADGGVDHSMMTPPEEQHYDRATYWLTASNNNSAVCGEMAAALAGCAYLVKDSDAAFAKECLKYAKALYNFGKNHSGNNLSGLAGYYDCDPMSADELALAEAWLYICGEGSKPTNTPSGGMYTGGADYYRYCWDKVWQGYAALMYKKTGDSAFKSELEFEVNNAGGVAAGKYNGDGWGAARYNCALQMSALAIADGSATSPYATGCKWQMDYILGANSTNYSFLIGYGSKWPTHIHHRAANPGDLSGNPEVKYTPYGCLVGGIDASGNYEDHSDKYQYTEGALDYNGCAALALAGLSNIFGGSDKGASKIVSSASEFKQGYTFGSGSTVVVTPTEPTTDATEPETQAPTQEPTQAPTQEPTQEPTQAPTQTSGSGELTYTEKKNDKDKTYWTINTNGSTKITVTLKTNSSDTETNGCFNPPGGWAPEDWAATPENGTFTVTYDNTSNYATVDLYVWWPETATIVSVAGEGGTAAQTEPTAAPTEATTEATQAPDSTKAVSMYGDTTCDNVVDILDVIALNKYLLGTGSLSDIGRLNADVDANNNIDSTDSLNILKCVVEMVAQSSFPVK